MHNPEHIGKVLKDHFATVSDDEFRRNVESFCPDLTSDTRQQVSSPSELPTMSQLTLFTPQETILPLTAYLASALTGLGKDQRSLIFHLSDVIATLCEKHGISLYEPRKQTDPVYHANISDIDVFKMDRERVLRSDLLIHLSHFPSTGSGEELDFAYSALLPIIIISRSEDHVSRMVTGIPSFTIHIKYQEPDELRERMDECLTRIRPVLEERKLAFAEYDTNIVGDRIRTLREELRLTRKDVEEAVPTITENTLKQLEENVDRLSNPTLIQLRQIAAVLKTTVADLVEPSMTSNVMSHLQDWLEGMEAARFSGISQNDRNRILRRILLRIIDSLEIET